MLCAIAKRASCPGDDGHCEEHLPVTSAPLSSACSPDGIHLVHGAPAVPDTCPVPEQPRLPQPKPSPICLTGSAFQDSIFTTSSATSTVTGTTLTSKPATLRGMMTTVPCTGPCTGSTPSNASPGGVSRGGELTMEFMCDVGHQCQNPEGAVAGEVPLSRSGQGRRPGDGTSAAPHPGRRPRRHGTGKPDASVLAPLMDGVRDGDAKDARWGDVMECSGSLGSLPYQAPVACVEDVVHISTTKATKISHGARTSSRGGDAAVMVSDITALTTGGVAAAATAPAAAGTVAIGADGDIGATAAAAPPMLPHSRVLPYNPYIRRASLFTKIPGYEPDQITPGFEQRLALLVAALGGGGSNSSSRRLGWVYIRPGCVELLLEEEEWGTSSSHGSEGEGPEDEAALPQQQQPEVCPTGGNETTSSFELAVSAEGAADEAAGLSSSRTRYCSSGSSSFSSMELAAIIQALQLRDERDLVAEAAAEGGEEEGEEEDQVAGGGGLRGATLVVGSDHGLRTAATAGLSSASARKPMCGGPQGEENPCHAESESVAPAAAHPPTANFRRTTAAEPHAHRTPFLLGSDGERQTGIRVAALQPRVLLIPPVTAAMAVTTANGAMGPLEFAQQPPSPSLQVQSAAARPALSSRRSLHDDEMASQPRPPPRLHGRQARSRSRGGSQPQSLPMPHADAQVTMRTDPWDTATQVLSLHPTGLSHDLNGISEQGRDAHPSGTGTMVQRNGGPNGGGGDGTAAAAARLRAAVYCPVTITREEGPRGLELLLRSHGSYLPLRARWRVGEGAAPEALRPLLPLAAAVELSGGHGGGAVVEHVEGDVVGAAAAPPPSIPSSQQLILGPAGGAVGGAIPDAMVGPDMNQLQLLELDLMELPRRPGIALVDFRWCDRPCRAVPLVLTTNPAVATELQAAVAGWSRPQAELDELLLDYGTWEFHVSGAVQWPPRRLSSSVPSGVSAISHRAPLNAPAPPIVTIASSSSGTSWTTAATPPASVTPNRDRGSSACSGDSPLHLSLSRLMDLSVHLLRYVSACGWVHTAEHMQRQLDSLHVVTSSTVAVSTVAAPLRMGAAWEAANSSASLTRPGGMMNASVADAGGGDDSEIRRALAPGGPVSAEGSGSASATAWESEEGEAALAGVQDGGPRGTFGASSGPGKPAVCGIKCGEGGGYGIGGGSAGGGDGNMVQRGIRRRRGGNGGDGGADSGGDGGSGGGGPRVLWASDVILPALGLGRTLPAVERAFTEYADPWICKLSPVLLFFDLSSLFALLLRERHNLFTTSSATVVVSCSVSFVVVLAWLVLPYTTWLRLLRASRYIRIASYCTAKALIVMSGFATPQGVQSYIRGWSMLLMEGLILPAASLLPPASAMAALSLLSVLSAKMRIAAGAVDLYGATLYGMATVALGLLTIAGCQIYLRYRFWVSWCGQRKRLA
ncbi:hypothetical protein Vretimale_1093 [Volvox reticuliferus]|uniref:Uncharacterized protein n=1 Tax=Volvox reticuliferus TaxID=1737510 RepID=A0A8J4CJ81_9CHLO|nr:hypothetical protein Vretifemale_10317 [Volvox reticuliferus]GIL95074.1 hypothetical protein Vretimale_1093 [Volvox reticuliferus]